MVAVLLTVRTMRWAPVATALACSALLVAVAGTDVRAGHELGLLAGAAVACAVPLALDDPAAALLSALPVTRRRRLLIRSALVGAAALTGWLALGASAPGADGLPGLLPLAALAAAGLAALARVLPRQTSAAPLVGAAVPLTWVGLRQLPALPLGLTTWWIEHAALTALTATALTLWWSRP